MNIRSLAKPSGRNLRRKEERALLPQSIIEKLAPDFSELETQVEELRSNVINRRCRVNMSNVESMALVLSKASKTVADLKNRFPSLHVPLSHSL